jgi:hypothetical protein
MQPAARAVNEATFWSSVVKPALHRPDARRVAWKVPAETRAGLPDVWWSRGALLGHVDATTVAIGGWLELKYVPAWPKRPDTPITVAVTAQQLAHLREAADGGARANVLVGVADSWFLFSPYALAAEGRLTQAELVTRAAARGHRSDAEGLRRALYAAR